MLRQNTIDAEKDSNPYGCHNPFCDTEMELGETAHRPAYTELWICTDCIKRWNTFGKPNWLTDRQKVNGMPKGSV